MYTTLELHLSTVLVSFSNQSKMLGAFHSITYIAFGHVFAESNASYALIVTRNISLIPSPRILSSWEANIKFYQNVKA